MSERESLPMAALRFINDGLSAQLKGVPCELCGEMAERDCEALWDWTARRHRKIHLTCLMLAKGNRRALEHYQARLDALPDQQRAIRVAQLEGAVKAMLEHWDQGPEAAAEAIRRLGREPEVLIPGEGEI